MTDAEEALLAPADRTVPAMLRWQVARLGGRPLLSIADERWSHADAPRRGRSPRGNTAKGGRTSRRSGRRDVRQQHRVPRVRMAGRGLGADQHRVDAPATAAHGVPRRPGRAVPRYIDIVDDRPCTENGKVQTFKLRERGVSPTTWDRPTSDAPGARR